MDAAKAGRPAIAVFVTLTLALRKGAECGTSSYCANHGFRSGNNDQREATSVGAGVWILSFLFICVPIGCCYLLGRHLRRAPEFAMASGMAARQEYATPPPPPQPGAVLPAGVDVEGAEWKKATAADPSTGRPYWYNEAGQTTWREPTLAGLSQVGQAQGDV